MQRYEMENDYEPYTGQHQGIIGVPDDCGDWVRAEDAERTEQQRDRLKEALEGLLDQLDVTPEINLSSWGIETDSARAVLKECEP